ncbi:MAG: hypothetical protein AB7E51_06645 [Pseudodesulfovibrio sp.]|uniref:hypothetical protein n=1 Tax=Pseudodesulfovibrio sp. TaxID=2035812 RepID=UPI003D115BFD
MFEPHTTPEQSGGQMHDMSRCPNCTNCIAYLREKVSKLEAEAKLRDEFIECVCSELGMEAPYDNEEAMLIAHDLKAENERLREALTPSTETKQEYFGNFDAYITDVDEDGNDITRKVIIGWDSIKDIMGAIKKRAGNGGNGK